MRKCLSLGKQQLFLTHQRRWLLSLKHLLLFIVFLSVSLSSLYAQQQTVTGRVTDENAQPLSGVSVKIKGTTTGTNTGTDGSFTINAGKGQVLEISYIG